MYFSKFLRAGNYGSLEVTRPIFPRYRLVPFPHYSVYAQPGVSHTCTFCRSVNARASWAESRELESQRPTKSYTALQTVRHRFNIYAGSCAALAL